MYVQEPHSTIDAVAFETASDDTLVWNPPKACLSYAKLPGRFKCGCTLQALQKRLLAVCRENEALRSELNAFDPAFFDEIEDLKLERHQLAEQVQRYRSRIHDYAAQPNVDADLS